VTDIATRRAAPDQAARDRIGDDLATNLFVEAGAGAGKTTSLVGRIMALVRTGVPIDAIAAITFTDKAAAELRHKVRDELAKAAARATGDELGLVTAALDRLDHAPIGTLHSFARRVLNEFPVAAGLPPGFTVLDELESDMRFTERLDELIEALLSDPEPPDGPIGGGAVFLEHCKRDKFWPNGFKRVAGDFHANWDLVEERVSPDAPAPWNVDTAALLDAARAVATTGCPGDDTQVEHCREVGEAAEQLASATTLTEQFRALDGLAKHAGAGSKKGAAAKWAKHPGDLAELRAAHARVHELAVRQLAAAGTYRKLLVGAIVRRWVLESAHQRADDGALEFHDLLVLARRLLAVSPEARRALHARYQRVLLDEFQDTDPIQLGIAVRLAAHPDDPHQAHGGDWTKLVPLPGRLFIVGDPKQSIYRFRRADIAQYLRAAEQVGADRELLTANFRSSAAVIGWVNEVFSAVIREQPAAQPAFQPLDVCRTPHADHGTVRVLGVEPHADLPRRGGADLIRGCEAADVVAAITTALDAGWKVGDTDPAGHKILRPCRPGDITVLLPARTSLPVLESALRAANVAYRAENSSVVYVTTEIRHLMLALRAADDASDELALVAALRTPLYGCSDPELYEWKSAGGKWSIWAAPPESFETHPVALAIAHLASLADRSMTTPPADLLAGLVDERRVLDAALDAPDARDVWRRVRFVVEQARAWADAGGHGLRRYLRWVALQATEARSADTVLPEHDNDAVRIMTVHAAKGLEFPITIVSGMSTQIHGAGGFSVVWPDGGWTIADARDDLFDAYKPVDEQLSDEERRRLLYVACTRAVDHLVVSLHRAARQTNKRTHAELLFECGAATATGVEELRAAPVPRVLAQPAPRELEWADPDEWLAARDRAVAAARVVATISPTALAKGVSDAVTLDTGLDKEPVDLDLPPWRRGRYGTAVGRAVHAVLQFCDLERGSDIAHHAAAQCAAEGILGMDDLVAELARSAIAAPVVRAALASRHHRELFVAAPVGARVLEGYIDLFVESPEGGLIVDYKTDQWFEHTSDGRAERDRRVAKYRTQLAAYAVALERITGVAPAGGVLVRCRPDGPADEIHVTGWAEAIGAARAAITELT